MALGVLGLTAAGFLMPSQFAPQADAAWSASQALESSSWLPFTAEPALGTTRGSDTVAVWTAQNPTDDAKRVRLRRISSTGALGSLVTVSPSPGSAGGMTVSHPAAAVDADGDVVVAWTAQDPAASNAWQVFARRLSRTGELGAVRRLGAVGAHGWNPTVAVGDKGGAVVTWESDNSQLAARFGLSSQVVGRFQVGQRTTSRAAQVKATPAGTFLLPGMNLDGRAELTTLRWDGTRSKSVLDPTHYSNAVDADADATGRTHIAYTRDVSTGDRLVVRRSTSSGLTAQAYVSPSTHDVRYATIDTDRDGDSLVSWVSRTGRSTFRLYLRQWRADGTFGPVQDLGQLETVSAASVYLPRFPAVAVDSDGDAIVAGTSSGDATWRRTVTRAGTVSSPTTVLGSGAGISTATITPAGRARVASHSTASGQVYLRAG
ncbi:hypothetical protein GCM10009809_14470 [Isoptericola hypogeus]|uniref:Pyrroloquinoline-quinone binding quinoprotein n=1 Tax=Isoptericola hypogeus TaxID=300179 RepID=A0ABP4V8B8_9MICO